MDDILSIIVSWQFVLLCVGIFAVIQFIRIIVEFFIPSAINARWWRSLCLPLFPLILGAIIGFFANKYKFEFPAPLITVPEKFMFCVGAGALSATVVRVIREMLIGRAQGMQPYNPIYSPNPYINNPMGGPVGPIGPVNPQGPIQVGPIMEPPTTPPPPIVGNNIGPIMSLDIPKSDSKK